MALKLWWVVVNKKNNLLYIFFLFLYIFFLNGVVCLIWFFLSLTFTLLCRLSCAPQHQPQEAPPHHPLLTKYKQKNVLDTFDRVEWERGPSNSTLLWVPYLWSCSSQSYKRNCRRLQGKKEGLYGKNTTQTQKKGKNKKRLLGKCMVVLSSHLLTELRFHYSQWQERESVC